MKPIAILLLAASFLTLTSGCATDVDDSESRPTNKQLADLDLADSEEQFSEGDEPIAAEDVIVDGDMKHRLYFPDGRIVITEL